MVDTVPEGVVSRRLNSFHIHRVYLHDNPEHQITRHKSPDSENRITRFVQIKIGNERHVCLTSIHDPGNVSCNKPQCGKTYREK